MSQPTYLVSVAKRFGLTERAPAHTPYVVGTALLDPKPEERLTAKQQKRYMEMVGSIMYAATQTRFDVAATVSILRIVLVCVNYKVA